MRASRIAAYWKRKYKGKNLDEPLYILTNLGSVEEALASYKARSGIEVIAIWAHTMRPYG